MSLPHILHLWMWCLCMQGKHEHGNLPASLSIHSLTALVAMLCERGRMGPSWVLCKAADLQKHSQMVW